MDCGVCQIRGSVGFCVVCRTLLCEECGTGCSTCGKLLCGEHIERSRSGRVLCPGCLEERKTQRVRTRRAVAEESARERAEGRRVKDEEEVEYEERVLVASAHVPPAPWKLSLFAAVVGVAATLVILIFPSFRRIPLLDMGYLSAPYLFLIFPALAIFWAVVGLRKQANAGERSRCFIGLGLAGVTVVLAFVAAVTDPAGRTGADALGAGQRPEHMTEEDLTEWRRQVLDKYNE